MIKITSTNDVIIVEGDELTRHYPNNGTLVIPKNSTIVLLDEASEMVLFKSASNYDTLFTGILGSISIEDEIVTRENIIEKFNAISNVNVGGNVDLFEVVQSLPTENINDNKVYLVLDSNGSEGNTYVEYLYVNGQWEELGKFKVNVDLSGYALKTDILSAKTDTRYTTYDVQNPILSGKTIVLQNEVTDSRKYHTLGYEKTISELVKATNHINVTRGNDNVPSMETDIESGISLNTNSNGFYNLSGSVTIPLDEYNELTTILHYEVSHVERDSEGNVTGGSSTSVVDVTYDTNTKVLSFPIDSVLFALITRTDTNKELFGGNNDGYAYTENGRQCYSFEQHPLQEGGTLIWNPYYSNQYFWNYSVTVDVNGLKEVQVSTDNKPERLNDYIRYANDVKAYILTDKNTTFKTINGEQITGNGDITIDTNVDLTPYATKEELNTKQDTITDLEAIRSGAAKGATALQSVPDTYATEQWVNEQGFLKEHQDISNLATKSELNAKQDVISDLETIRSGAALGSTALQSVPDTYALKSEIPDISTKQDKLVSGTNIKTVNGTSLLGSGDITIEGGSGNVDLSDYYTKTETNALVNPKLQQVTLTQAEYDALQTKEENVLYVISDAEDLKFKTINGQQITGEGNIVIEASADNVPTVQTTPNGTTSNYIYSTISHTNPQYSVISDISNFITYSTDKASIKTWKQYWGQKSSNTYQDLSINAATTSDAGLMSASDKTKLDGIDLTPYATKTELNAKQDTLVSGTNIKTVNGISLIGEGNITVSSEGVVDLSGYYTKAEIDAMIGGASNTITEINNLLG